MPAERCCHPSDVVVGSNTPNGFVSIKVIALRGLCSRDARAGSNAEFTHFLIFSKSVPDGRIMMGGAASALDVRQAEVAIKVDMWMLQRLLACN